MKNFVSFAMDLSQRRNVASHGILDIVLIITCEFNKLSFLSQEFKCILKQSSSKQSKKSKEEISQEIFTIDFSLILFSCYSLASVEIIYCLYLWSLLFNRAICFIYNALSFREVLCGLYQVVVCWIQMYLFIRAGGYIFQGFYEPANKIHYLTNYY